MHERLYTKLRSEISIIYYLSLKIPLLIHIYSLISWISCRITFLTAPVRWETTISCQHDKYVRKKLQSMTILSLCRQKWPLPRLVAARCILISAWDQKGLWKINTKSLNCPYVSNNANDAGSGTTLTDSERKLQMSWFCFEIYSVLSCCSMAELPYCSPHFISAVYACYEDDGPQGVIRLYSAWDKIMHVLTDFR